MSTNLTLGVQTLRNFGHGSFRKAARKWTHGASIFVLNSFVGVSLKSGRLEHVRILMEVASTLSKDDDE